MSLLVYRNNIRTVKVYFTRNTFVFQRRSLPSCIRYSPRHSLLQMQMHWHKGCHNADVRLILSEILFMKRCRLIWVVQLRTFVSFCWMKRHWKKCIIM